MADTLSVPAADVYTDRELLAHVEQRLARTYAALSRLETAGRVVSEWAAGPKPRRRVYRVVRAEAGK